MSLDRAPNLDAAPIAKVKLAGRDWDVAPFTLRQVLAVADFVPKLSTINASNITGERLRPMTEVVRIGLQRAYPQMTEAEFYDLPISIAEIVAAIPAVIAQAGGRRAEDPAGEPEAASDSTRQTGASSSPTSA